MFETACEGILVTDSHASIISANASFSEITGYANEEVKGKNPRLLQSGRTPLQFYRNMWAALNDTGQWRGEIWNRRKNGEVFPAWATISVVKDGQGRTTNYVCLYTDITSRKQTEERLAHLATHDPLTDLPNRAMFRACLSDALPLAKRNRRKLAVMLLDVDHFKNINDTLGHTNGDVVLQTVAQRLLGCLRDGDSAARLGGDEFTLLLSEISDMKDASLVAERILQKLAEPLSIDHQMHAISASIGISVYPVHGKEAETLLKKADEAMYIAKEERNCYTFSLQEGPPHKGPA